MKLGGHGLGPEKYQSGIGGIMNKIKFGLAGAW
jgi:hypothetical protein